MMSDPSPRADESAWSELEHAFFAAAPPDDPEPPAEPLRFDDDAMPGPSRRPPWTLHIVSAVGAAATRFVAALAGRRLDTQIVAVALAATALIVSLTARAPARMAALPAGGGCSDACLSPRDPTLLAFECAGVVDLETDLRSQYCCL